MSSRQALTRRQNRSTMRPLPLGASSAHKALCVKIDWTEAAVVKVATRSAVALDIIECDVRHESITELRHIAYTVEAGETLYFAASDDHPGYYYILRYNGVRFVCTCPAGGCHKACHHQEDVNVFLVSRQEAKQAREAAAIAQMSAGLAAIGQRMAAKLGEAKEIAPIWDVDVDEEFAA